ncbi:hypothetical protein T439DRAFT_320885 [Meredithblackwellia eburnea MCA 4105]
MLNSTRFQPILKATLSASYATRRPRPLLGKYTTVPVELFRVNSSDKVALRDYDSQMKMERTAYDLHLKEDGLVHPSQGDMFNGPNGCSLRPDGPMMQEVIRNFESENIVVWRIPQGLQLPSNLIILHEHTDHHSLQLTEPMTLSEFNKTLTSFFQSNCEAMTQKEWTTLYPFRVDL